jgi:hypothetical protein
VTDYDDTAEAGDGPDPVDDIDAQIEFLQAIRDVRVRYQEAKKNRGSDREGWAAAKAEHAQFRSYYRMLREQREAVDASVAASTLEGSAQLHGGGAVTTEA